MSSITVNCGNIEISNVKKICIIAGPCQLETEQHAMDMAGKIKEITSKYGLGFIYKTSFDKANRTSLKGKRGAGLEASLPVFDKIKKELKNGEIDIIIGTHALLADNIYFKKTLSHIFNNLEPKYKKIKFNNVRNRAFTLVE